MKLVTSIEAISDSAVLVSIRPAAAEQAAAEAAAAEAAKLENQQAALTAEMAAAATTAAPATSDAADGWSELQVDSPTPAAPTATLPVEAPAAAAPLPAVGATTDATDAGAPAAGESAGESADAAYAFGEKAAEFAGAGIERLEEMTVRASQAMAELSSKANPHLQTSLEGGVEVAKAIGEASRQAFEIAKAGVGSLFSDAHQDDQQQDDAKSIWNEWMGFFGKGEPKSKWAPPSTPPPAAATEWPIGDTDHSDLNKRV